MEKKQLFLFDAILRTLQNRSSSLHYSSQTFSGAQEKEIKSSLMQNDFKQKDLQHNEMKASRICLSLLQQQRQNKNSKKMCITVRGSKYRVVASQWIKRLGKDNTFVLYESRILNKRIFILSEKRFSLFIEVLSMMIVWEW